MARLVSAGMRLVNLDTVADIRVLAPGEDALVEVVTTATETTWSTETDGGPSPYTILLRGEEASEFLRNALTAGDLPRGQYHAARERFGLGGTGAWSSNPGGAHRTSASAPASAPAPDNAPDKRGDEE